MSSSGGEAWRPIPGIAGYEASDGGRIRSVDRVLINARGQRRRHRGVVLTPHADDQGYLRVRLGRHSGGRKTWKVHVLVALAFHGTRPPGAQVRHKNGQPNDCRPANLHYGTRGDNARDSVGHGTHNQASKEADRFGHLLVEPNLRANTARAGRRGCLACNRARSTIRRRGGGDLRTVADEHYRRIMAAAPAGARAHA